LRKVECVCECVCVCVCVAATAIRLITVAVRPPHPSRRSLSRGVPPPWLGTRMNSESDVEFAMDTQAGVEVVIVPPEEDRANVVESGVSGPKPSMRRREL